MNMRASVPEIIKGPARGLIRGFWALDKQLGYPVFGVRENRRTKDRWTQFTRDLEARRSRYSDAAFPIRDHTSVVEQLRTDGFAVVSRAMDVSKLLRVRDELEHCLDTGTRLQKISNDTVRRAGDLDKPASVFLTRDDTALGQSYFRDKTNFAAVDEPFLACRGAIDVAFDDLLFDIAARYLDCVPAIGGCNLRKSFVNDIAEFDTLHFHADPNSPKFLKYFFYLNDVDINGGPFCYVRGSHRERFRGWRSKYRWTHEEIASVYGEDRIMYLTAKRGDMVIADTNGFHRGTKVRSADRLMLTIDYVIHTEFDGAQAPFKIGARDHAALSVKQQAAADLLAVVPDPL
jgi:hypothetical protein